MNPALENVRRLVEWSRQDCSDVRLRTPPVPIGSVGIIGAGMMGTAIAAAHVRHGLPVVISDIDPNALARAPAAIAAELARFQEFEQRAPPHCNAGAFWRQRSSRELSPHHGRSGGGGTLRPGAGIDRRDLAGKATTVLAIAGPSGRPSDRRIEHLDDPLGTPRRGHARGRRDSAVCTFSTPCAGGRWSRSCAAGGRANRQSRRSSLTCGASAECRSWWKTERVLS